MANSKILKYSLSFCAAVCCSTNTKIYRFASNFHNHSLIALAWMKSKQVKKEDKNFWEQAMQELSAKNLPESKKFLYLPIIYDHFKSEGKGVSESVFDVLSVIKAFEVVKNRLPSPDLNIYKSFSELRGLVNSEYLKVKEEKQQNRQQKKIVDVSDDSRSKVIESGEAAKVFENENVVVFRIDSADAAKALGSDTPWCITKSPKYYTMYVSNNLIFYFVENKGVDAALSKVAIRAIRDFDGNVTDLKYTSKLNDGDSGDVSKLPNIEEYRNIIERDASQQPIGLVALIKNKKATTEQVREYWHTLSPASYKEKVDIVKQLNLIDYDIPEINWFKILSNASEEEILEYIKSNGSDAATLEMLAKVTQNQKVLSSLWKSNYPSVMPIVARNTTDLGIMGEAASSTYNSTKMGLIWNRNVPIEYIEYIKDNFSDDGNYNEFDDESVENDLTLINNRLNYSKDEEDKVIQKQDPQLAYKFAIGFPGADRARLQEIVMQDPKWAYWFAKYIPGADIGKLQEAVMQEPEWAYWFASEIPGADIGGLQEVMQDPEWAYEFAKDIPGADIARLQEVVMKYPKWAYEFAKDIPGADIAMLQEVVMQDPKSAYFFATYIPGANIGRLQEVVMQDPESAYFFAKDIPGADIAKLQEAVMKYPKWAYNFAKGVPGADIGKLQEAVMQDPKWAQEFVRDIPGADKSVMQDPKWAQEFAK